VPAVVEENPSIRLVLASGSPARLRVLRSAGLDPQVIVSGVDEDAVTAVSVTELASTLARLKAEAVAGGLDSRDEPTLVLGCDSLLELDGVAHGKPGDAAAATERWHRLSGRSGVLHTGHHVILIEGDRLRVRSRVCSTTVHFAELSAAEIEAYVATGEPLDVAGGFTIDGLGGAFVTGLEGDHSNVIGISLPLLRTMLADLGVPWPALWRTAPAYEHR
jgi:septum formation protein